VRSVRRFPFGQEPARPRVERTVQLPPPEPRTTAPLVGFVPPEQVLPFRVLVLPPPPIVPATPPAHSRTSFETAATIVLAVLGVAITVCLIATWGR